MNKDFITAVEEIEREKGISKEILFERRQIGRASCRERV